MVNHSITHGHIKTITQIVNNRFAVSAPQCFDLETRKNIIVIVWILPHNSITEQYIFIIFRYSKSISYTLSLTCILVTAIVIHGDYINSIQPVS